MGFIPGIGKNVPNLKTIRAPKIEIRSKALKRKMGLNKHQKGHLEVDI